MAHLSEQEIEEFREIFNLLDRDGGGSISAEELTELTEMIGIEASTKDIEHMIASIDTSGEGEIGFEVFMKFKLFKNQNN